MLGGAYLCYEGAEKVYEFLFPHGAHAHEAKLEPVAIDAKTFEDEKVASAIKTDFILSAEIMAITLAAIPAGNIVTQGMILAVVGIGITAAVYGVVALIVKADDLGLALARLSPASRLAGLAAPLRLTGRALVQGMPCLLSGLATIGTAAMIWVGGGIILHGLEEFGLGWPGHALHDAGAAVARAVPFAGAFVAWLVEAAGRRGRVRHPPVGHSADQPGAVAALAAGQIAYPPDPVAPSNVMGPQSGRHRVTRAADRPSSLT